MWKKYEMFVCVSDWDYQRTDGGEGEARENEWWVNEKNEATKWNYSVGFLMNYVCIGKREKEYWQIKLILSGFIEYNFLTVCFSFVLYH